MSNQGGIERKVSGHNMLGVVRPGQAVVTMGHTVCGSAIKLRADEHLIWRGKDESLELFTDRDDKPWTEHGV